YTCGIQTVCHISAVTCSTPALCFVVTSRPPPRSPLFPYTTLFRSHHRARLPIDVHPLWAEHEHLGRLDHLLPGGAGRLRAPGAGDRKSTRLNSSHGSISYAVFCLKKTKVSLKIRFQYEYVSRRTQL